MKMKEIEKRVCAQHREYARDYIVSFMLANNDKEAILVPYHPV